MTRLVALAMPGGPAFVEHLQRVWAEGDAVIPVDLRLPAPAIATLCSEMGVSEIIDGWGHRSSLPYGRPLEKGDALVVATSGTTGEPKGVIHTHDSVAASARITSAGLGVTDDDHWLACLPLAHIGGLSVITRALITGTKLTVHDGFDAEAVERAARNGVTLVSLVNAALRRVDPTLFRKILLGGAAPAGDRPANTVATYGMTETGSGVVYDGVPLEGVEFRTNEDGVLEVRSPTLLRAYTSGEDPKTADGWFTTGDAGAINADGTIEVFGRVGDVINTGGEKVWPVAVEQVLKLHPSINDALVFGEADDEWGQRVVAAIEVTGEAPSLEEVRALVKEHLAPYAAPRELRVIDALPRTNSGKVKRQRAL